MKFKVKGQPATGPTTKDEVSGGGGRRGKRAPERGVWGQVERLLDGDGIAIPERPDDSMGAPPLPEDLTALGDEQLMELFTVYVRWLEYVGMRKVRAEVLAKEAAAALQRGQAAAMQRSALGSEERVTFAKAARDLDPDVQTFETYFMTNDAYARALGTSYDGAERKVSLVSRELTRRTSAEPYERRSHRWSGAGG